jgi:hypothetical protein
MGSDLIREFNDHLESCFSRWEGIVIYSSPSCLVIMSSQDTSNSGTRKWCRDERCRREREGTEVVSWLIIRPSFARHALRKLTRDESSSAKALTSCG